MTDLWQDHSEAYLWTLHNNCTSHLSTEMRLIIWILLEVNFQKLPLNHSFSKNTLDCVQKRYEWLSFSSGWIPWILNPWRIHGIQKVLKLTIYKAKLSQKIKGTRGSQGLQGIRRIQGFLAFFQQCWFSWIPQGFRIRGIQGLLKECKKSLDSSDSLESLISLDSFGSLT